MVATCPNGRDALIDALGLRPHVVLTDLGMPRMDGIELTRQLREKLPETAVVVLTVFDDDEKLFAALKAGAIDYVLKDASLDQIVAAMSPRRRRVSLRRVSRTGHRGVCPNRPDGARAAGTLRATHPARG